MNNQSEFIQRLINERERDKAYEELLDLYQQRLYWHIRKIVITHDNASDVLQNVFLRIYKSLPNFKGQSSLKTWMYTIAYNESLRFIKKEKRNNHASINDEDNNYINKLTQDDEFEGNEVQLKLHRVLAKLPEKQRIIFQMKYFDDLKFREISDILNIKEGTLKSSYYSSVKFIEKNILTVELLGINEV